MSLASITRGMSNTYVKGKPVAMLELELERCDCLLGFCHRYLGRYTVLAVLLHELCREDVAHPNAAAIDWTPEYEAVRLGLDAVERAWRGHVCLDKGLYVCAERSCQLHTCMPCDRAERTSIRIHLLAVRLPLKAMLYSKVSL